MAFSLPDHWAPTADKQHTLLSVQHSLWEHDGQVWLASKLARPVDHAGPVQSSPTTPYYLLLARGLSPVRPLLGNENA